MSGLLSEQSSVHGPAGLLVAARVANVVVGLGTIPVFIHFLGGDGFAAWALLLALSAAFSVLEIGMPPTFIKHAAPLIQQGDWRQASVVLCSSATLLAGVFLLAAAPVAWLATRIATQLQLPDGDWLPAADIIVLIFAAVGVRALLQLGVHTLSAGRRFRALATFSFLQSLASNLAAAIAAIISRRVDVTLLAYWGAQLLVSAAGMILSLQLFPSLTLAAMPRLRTMRELMPHGLKVQVCDWAQIVTFQFDKFIIASFVGLWGVGPYEVANRSVLALRSIPSSGLDSFLPSAAIGQEVPEEGWKRYQTVTRLAAFAVVVFMIAPLAIAPVFLYAWTGQMGYIARGAFAGLMIGAAANVLALPAAVMVQAAGRADVQARSAVVTMLINVPLSLVLLFEWGMAGAAIGTAIAMISGAVLLLVDAHRVHGRPLAPTLGIIGEFWPALVVCVVVAAITYFPFEQWLASLEPLQRFAWRTRVVPALLCGLAYVVCLGLMIWIQVRRGLLTPEQRALLSSWFGGKGPFSASRPH